MGLASRRARLQEFMALPVGQNNGALPPHPILRGISSTFPGPHPNSLFYMVFFYPLRDRSALLQKGHVRQIKDDAGLISIDAGKRRGDYA
jgi:hypothetical protein